MSGARVPRIVLVRRPSEYEVVLARHGSRGQAAFFLERHGLSVDVLADRHQRLEGARQTVLAGVPSAWRRTEVLRDDLDRFLFEPGDIVVAVGQDGLVANVAKYLAGQPVVGINPDPERYEGVLVRLPPTAGGAAMRAAATEQVCLERRTMVEVEVEGRSLIAVNEIYLGHRTHQSARYTLACPGGEERQSSSGVIVATGTGASGWARSIHRQRRTDVGLPDPEEPRLAFFTREAWPSVDTGTTLTDGELTPGEELILTSEMEVGGTVFGDGIETDALDFGWGNAARVRLAGQQLNLVVG